MLWQWLIFGSQRLVSNRYGPNVPLPFDGVRAILNVARSCPRTSRATIKADFAPRSLRSTSVTFTRPEVEISLAVS
jgi:hypothetical protein